MAVVDTEIGTAVVTNKPKRRTSVWRAFARWSLVKIAPLARLRAVRRLVSSLDDSLCALVGKGGGSGWDLRGETFALARFAPRRSGLVVFDVGANNGEWALALHRRLAEQRPKFHLFECAPYCFDALEERARSIPGATIVKKAVADETGTVALFVPSTGSGLASMHERRDTSVQQHAYSRIEVPATTLDAYIEAHGIERVDVLKIDIEGGEARVLAGAKHALSRGIIDTVMFEFGSANVNSRTFFRDFWELFDGHGFRLCRVIPGGGHVPIEGYDDTLEYFRGASNYIAKRSARTLPRKSNVAR